jgi:hypothetical protein
VLGYKRPTRRIIVAINTNNAHAYGDLTQRIMTAAVGSAAPATPLPTAWSAAWKDLGWMDDGGVTENQTYQETKKYGWQGGSVIRVLRSQAEHTFQFNCLEENAITLGLLRPGSPTVTTGSAAEVQTITITGIPTGGTFLPSIPGFLAIAAQPYNVSTAALATALSTAVGGTVTVTGTAGATYICTFPAVMGNMPDMAVDGSALTGGTSPAASSVVTTPGVNGTNTTSVKPFTGRAMRSFGLDLVDGDVHKRYVCHTGEVMGSGDVVYKADDLTVYQFTLNCFPDTNGNFFVDINDNPALANGLFV